MKRILGLVATGSWLASPGVEPLSCKWAEEIAIGLHYSWPATCGIELSPYEWRLSGRERVNPQLLAYNRTSIIQSKCDEKCWWSGPLRNPGRYHSPRLGAGECTLFLAAPIWNETSITLSWRRDWRETLGNGLWLQCHRCLLILLWFNRFSWISISSFVTCP